MTFFVGFLTASIIYFGYFFYLQKRKDVWEIYLDYDKHVKALQLASQESAETDSKLIFHAFAYKNDSKKISQVDLIFIDTFFADEIMIPKEKQNCG